VAFVGFIGCGLPEASCLSEEAGSTSGGIGSGAGGAITAGAGFPSSQLSKIMDAIANIRQQ